MTNNGYENAPATEMLATFCACCGRPLLDAKSVEIGMGPHCRKAHGFNKPDETVTDLGMAFFLLVDLLATNPRIAKAFEAGDTRQLANAIVHKIALEQGGPTVPMLAQALHTIGFRKLAEKCVEATSVKITEDAGKLVVKAPYSDAFNEACRKVPGATWVKALKARTVPVASKGHLWGAIKASFPKGTTVFGTKVVVL